MRPYLLLRIKVVNILVKFAWLRDYSDIFALTIGRFLCLTGESPKENYKMSRELGMDFPEFTRHQLSLESSSTRGVYETRLQLT